MSDEPPQPPPLKPLQLGDPVPLTRRQDRDLELHLMQLCACAELHSDSDQRSRAIRRLYGIGARVARKLRALNDTEPRVVEGALKSIAKGHAIAFVPLHIDDTTLAAWKKLLGFKRAGGKVKNPEIHAEAERLFEKLIEFRRAYDAQPADTDLSGHRIVRGAPTTAWGSHASKAPIDGPFETIAEPWWKAAEALLLFETNDFNPKHPRIERLLATHETKKRHCRDYNKAKGEILRSLRRSVRSVLRAAYDQGESLAYLFRRDEP